MAFAVMAEWRQATPEELDALIPERAPVVAERVETERTSMSGIVDKHGHFVAAAVLITAGYSANGRYSDFLLTQLPVEMNGTKLPAGKYLLGWTRSAEGLAVTVSEAVSGKAVAELTATENPLIHRVAQVRVWPAGADGACMVQLGRFAFRFKPVN